MSVTVEPDTDPVGNDRVPGRAEQLRLCHLFNERYADGIESPRRKKLKERIDLLLPEIGKILLEAEAVVEGERRRYIEAVDRMAYREGLSAEETMMLDTVDARTQTIWDCCEALYQENTRECLHCGEPAMPATTLDDVRGIMGELSKLLAEDKPRKERQ